MYIYSTCIYIHVYANVHVLYLHVLYCIHVYTCTVVLLGECFEL